MGTGGEETEHCLGHSFQGHLLSTYRDPCDHAGLGIYCFRHLSREEKKTKSLLSRSLVFVMVKPCRPVEEFLAGDDIMGLAWQGQCVACDAVSRWAGGLWRRLQESVGSEWWLGPERGRGMERSGDVQEVF